MKVLVANLGSTSFKYRLFDMSDERQLARGGVERIGSSESRCFVEIGEYRGEMTKSIPVHGVAVEACISQLTDPTHGCIKDASEISAIGFNTMVLPYQVPPVVVGMQAAGISLATTLRLVFPLAALGILVFLPLEYLWWRLIGYFG